MTPIEYQEKIQALRQSWKDANREDRKIIEVRAKLLKMAYSKASTSDLGEQEVLQALL